MTLIIRQSIKTDAPDLYDLLKNHMGGARHDNLVTDKDFVMAVCGDETLCTVTTDEVVTGFIFIDGLSKGTYGLIHFLVYPKYWRQWIKDDVFEKYLDMCFKRYGIIKLKVAVMHDQVERRLTGVDATGKPLKRLTPLGKLLVRLRFFRIGQQRNEYMVDGKPRNGIIYELQRSFWLKYRKEQQARKAQP